MNVTNRGLFNVENLGTKQGRIQDFKEGGSNTVARVKFFKPRPLRPKPRPFSCVSRVVSATDQSISTN